MSDCSKLFIHHIYSTYVLGGNGCISIHNYIHFNNGTHKQIIAESNAGNFGQPKRMFDSHDVRFRVIFCVCTEDTLTEC